MIKTVCCFPKCQFSQYLLNKIFVFHCFIILSFSYVVCIMYLYSDTVYIALLCYLIYSIYTTNAYCVPGTVET